MSRVRRALLSWLNRAGQRMPRSWLRRIADFPGMLRLFTALSRDQIGFVTTPEGFSLALNPLLHANLLAGGGLAGYEPDLQRAIREYARPGMAAYDIGANVGVFSLLFWSCVRGDGGCVYAFEPEPNNTACFERTLARDRSLGIVLSRQAVGAAPGVGRFDRRGGAFSGRLVGDGGAYAPTGNIAQVETTSVDALVLEHGCRAPDIVKIDVEGNEGLVLDGMAEVMRRFHPVILCEIHTHLGDSGERVLERLFRHDYRVMLLDGTSLRPGDPGLGDVRGHVIAVV
jgi:FkbM family methyltransferase